MTFKYGIDHLNVDLVHAIANGDVGWLEKRNRVCHGVGRRSILHFAITSQSGRTILRKLRGDKCRSGGGLKERDGAAHH